MLTLVPKSINHDRFHCGGQFPSSSCSFWCPNPLIMIILKVVAIPIHPLIMINLTVVASALRPHVHFGTQIT